MASCPICGRPVPAREHPAPSPFCSTRCKQVDLGRWLDGGYRLAGAALEDADEPEAALAPAPPVGEDDA